MIGVAAVVLFFVARGLRHPESGGEPRAVVAEKTATPPAAREAEPVARTEKAPVKAAESRPAPPIAAEEPAPKVLAPMAAPAKRKPEVKQAPEVKAAGPKAGR